MRQEEKDRKDMKQVRMMLHEAPGRGGLGIKNAGEKKASKGGKGARTHEIHEDCLFFSEATIKISQHAHDARGLDFQSTAAVCGSDFTRIGEGVELRQPG